MPRDGDAVAARLLAALAGRDDLAFAALVSGDVRLVVDAGDATGGEFRGRVQAARALAALLARHPDASLEAAEANGAPALVLRCGTGAGAGSGAGDGAGDVLAVLGLELAASGTIVAVWVQTAPEKLESWNRHNPPPRPV